ncbi:MAG: hypothetical protein V4450_01935 [Bacteroidota bacterium]
MVHFIMTQDRTNRIVLGFLFGISVFLLLDCYVFPLDTSNGVLVTKTGGTDSRLRVAIYRIETEQGLITAPLTAYNDIKVNDTIEVGRSYITHANLKVSVHGKGAAYSWRIGFIALGGLDFLIFLISSNALYLFFFYKKSKEIQMRRDITIFLTCINMLFFLFCILFA